MTTLAHNDEIRPAFNSNKDTVQTAAILDDWKPSDSTKTGIWSLQIQQRSYYQNIMDWDKDEGHPSGAPIIDQVDGDTGLSNVDDRVDEDQESRDRVALLAKKYASEKITLNKEDNARLEMITQKIELKYPRYSTSDWNLLDEAADIINEFYSITGAES